MNVNAGALAEPLLSASLVTRAQAGDQVAFTRLIDERHQQQYEEAGRATLSSDQRSIIFASTRAGGRGGADLWTATRVSLDESFGAAESLGELNSSDGDIDPSLSDDGRELWFVSDRRGRPEIWRATRPCD